MNAKIVNKNEIDSVVSATGKESVVLVGGCYDLLHYGHFSFLKAAKAKGSILVVALESDDFIKKYKKRHPIHTQMQRAEILAALEYVDVVVLLPLMESDEDYAQLVEQIKPSIIAITEGDPQVTNKQKHASRVGATVEQVSPLVESFSTSSIIEYANLLRD